LDYSAVLGAFENQSDNIDISKVLKYARHEEACDLAMMLLIGINNVPVPRRLFVQFYSFLQELKINDDVNEENGDFKQNFLKKYLSEPAEDNVLKIYDMAVHLNLSELKQQCVQFLIARDYKDLNSKNNSGLYQLTEIPFIQLIKQALSNKESADANKRSEYQDLLMKFFQNKANSYSQELFSIDAGEEAK